MCERLFSNEKLKLLLGLKKRRLDSQRTIYRLQHIRKPMSVKHYTTYKRHVKDTLWITYFSMSFIKDMTAVF